MTIDSYEEHSDMRQCFSCDEVHDIKIMEARNIGKKASPFEPVRAVEVFFCPACRVKRTPVPSESVWQVSEEFEGNVLVDELPEGWYVVNFAAPTCGGVWCGPYRWRSDAESSIEYLKPQADERLLYVAAKDWR